MIAHLKWVIYQDAEKNCSNAAANETFPSFLRWNFNKWSTAEEETENIGPDVVNYDHGDRNDEPATHTEVKNVDKINISN